MTNRDLKVASLLLQVGLAFVFLYAALASTLRPNDWVGYLPTTLKSFIPANTLLNIFSIYEVLLSVWLLSSRKVFYVSILTAVTLFFITIINLSIFDVTFRDVSLTLAAVALAFISRKGGRVDG